MSEVFLGLNPKTREKRAFKILASPPHYGHPHIHAFARSEHHSQPFTSGIIQILKMNVNECYFYSMEYMPGGNLTRILQKGKMPTDQAVQLFL